MKEQNYQQSASKNQSAGKSFPPNIETKKQIRRSGITFLAVSLILALGAVGFLYWDYRQQVKFYNFWERGSGLDFKTGKPIPNYQPPPYRFRYDRMVFLPYIVILGSVSMLIFLLGAAELRKSSKMIETENMRRADAEREAFENSPEIKKIFGKG